MDSICLEKVIPRARPLSTVHTLSSVYAAYYFSTCYMCLLSSKMSPLQLSPRSGEAMVELGRRSAILATHELAAINSMNIAGEGNGDLPMGIAQSKLVSPALDAESLSEPDKIPKYSTALAKEDGFQNVPNSIAHSQLGGQASVSKPSLESQQKAKGNLFMKFLKRAKSSPQPKVADKNLVTTSNSTPVSTWTSRRSLPANPVEMLDKVRRKWEGETKALKPATAEDDILAKEEHEIEPNEAAHSKLADPASVLIQQSSLESGNPVKRSQNWFRNISKRTRSDLQTKTVSDDYLNGRSDKIWAQEFSTLKITPAAALAIPLPLSPEEALQEFKSRSKRTVKQKQAAAIPVRSLMSSSEPKSPIKVSKHWFSIRVRLPARRRPKLVSRQPLPGLEEWPARPRLLLAEPSLLHFLPAVGSSYAILPETYAYLRDLTQRRDGSLIFKARLSQVVLDNGWFGQKVGNFLGSPIGSFKMRTEAYRTYYHGREPQLKPVQHIESKEVMRSKKSFKVPENMHVLVRIPECVVDVDDLCWEEYKSSRGIHRRLRIKARLARWMMSVVDLMFDINVPIVHTRRYLESLHGDHESHPPSRVHFVWHRGIPRRLEKCEFCERREKHEILTSDGNIDIVANHLKGGRPFCVSYMFQDSEAKWDEWKMKRAQDDDEGHDRSTQGFELPQEGHFYQNQLLPQKIGTGCLGCDLLKPPPVLRPLNYVFDSNRNWLKQSIGSVFEDRLRSSDRRGWVPRPGYCYSDKCSSAKLEEPWTHHELNRWERQAIAYYPISGHQEFIQSKVSRAQLPPTQQPLSISVAQKDDSLDPPNSPKPAQWHPEQDVASSAPPTTWRCTKNTPCPPCESENKEVQQWRPNARCPFSYHTYRELAVHGCIVLDGFTFDQPSSRFPDKGPFYNTTINYARRAKPRRPSIVAMLEHKAAAAEMPFAAAEADELLEAVAIPTRNTNRKTATLEQLPFFSVADYDTKEELKIVNKGKGKADPDSQSSQDYNNDRSGQREMTHPEFLESIGKPAAQAFQTACTSQSKNESSTTPTSPGLTPM